MIWDEHTLLMVDLDLVESEEDTSMVRDEAWKHPANPIVSEGDRDLFLGREGYRVWVRLLCRHQGSYRLWYSFEAAGDVGHEARRLPAGRAMCQDTALAERFAYAESDNGIHFRPARVGTVRLGGSRNNNLVRVTNRPGLSWAGMMLDPLDRDFPFKAVVLRQGDVGQMDPGLQAKYPANNKRWYGHGSEGWFVWGLARSRDGFSWEMPRHRHNLVNAIIEGPTLFRALDGGFVISNQMVSKVSDIGWRKVKGWLTYDGVTSHRIPDFVFALPDHMTMVVPAFLGTQAWAGTPWVQSHVGLVPARKGLTMLALHGYLYGAVGCETYAQTAEIGLAVSATGCGFHQVWPFRPFLRRGNMGEWDCGLAAQAALVDDGDETRIYYVASDVGNAAGCPYRVGIGRIGRDRYGYRVLRVYRDWAAAKDRRGVVTLKPVRLPAKPRLGMNVTHVTPRRTVRMALLDEASRPIPGFTLARCEPVAEEGVFRPVRWKDADPDRLAGANVKVRVELHSPDCRYADQHSPRVYAVCLKEPNDR